MQVESNDASAKGWDVILVGGSMLESWRGTMMGLTYPGHSKVPAMVDRYFKNPWKPTKFETHVLAISGAAGPLSPTGASPHLSRGDLLLTFLPAPNGPG